MSLTERELQTKENYDVNAEVWLERSGGRNRPSFWREEMGHLFWLLKLNSKILEIGCGTATDGKYLKDLGMNPVSVDYSSSMLGIAKELNPQAKLLQMDAYDMGFPNNSFDGFWATASLLHLENTQNALKEIVRVTKDRGVGFISVKEGEDAPGIDPKTGYFFKYFTDNEFKTYLLNSGFEIIKAGIKTGTPRHEWLTYIVKVNKW